MVTKAEAERAIRHMATEWARETGYKPQPGHYPSFSSFCQWLEERHYSGYLRFSSRSASPEILAEGWFEAELRRHC